MHRSAAVGEWPYDGTAPTRVLVVRLDFDFWYELAKADGTLEPDEQPVMNADGHAYYVRYRPGWSEGERFWPDSGGFLNLTEAKQEAEATLPGPGRWRDAT